MDINERFDKLSRYLYICIEIMSKTMFHSEHSQNQRYYLPKFEDIDKLISPLNYRSYDFFVNDQLVRESTDYSDGLRRYGVALANFIDKPYSVQGASFIKDTVIERRYYNYWRGVKYYTGMVEKLSSFEWILLKKV